jgi:hypothetical protein
MIETTLDLILESIPNIDLYNWKIIYINGASEADFNMIEFENTVNKCIKGYSISSSKLIKLSKKIIYLIDIDIIGDLKSSKLDDVKEEIYDFRISLVDSSYWEIYSSNTVFLEKWIDNKDVRINPTGASQ